jgi:hypothetical protein
MSIQRSPSRTSTIDVLDRILDKGVVIDAQVQVSVAGIHLVDINARVIVASIETYVKHAAEVADVERQLRVTIVAEPKPLPAVREPVRRPSPARRRRPRATHGLIAYRCQDGCAFWRTSSAPRTTETACPYRPDVVCALRRASAPAA